MWLARAVLKSQPYFFVCATPWPTIMMIFKRVHNHASSPHFSATWQKFGGILQKGSGWLQSTHNRRGSNPGRLLQTATQRPVLPFMTDSVCIPGCFWPSPDRDESHSAGPSAASAPSSIHHPTLPSKLRCLTKHIWRTALTKAGLHLGFGAPVALVCVSEAPVIYTERKFARDTRHTLQIANLQCMFCFFFLLSALNKMF